MQELTGIRAQIDGMRRIRQAKPKKWYPIECEHGYDCCPQCDGQRRDPKTLRPVSAETHDR